MLDRDYQNVDWIVYQLDLLYYKGFTRENHCNTFQSTSEIVCFKSLKISHFFVPVTSYYILE